MVDRRYQVFISSTYTDLVEERAEVIQAVLELDGLPAGMEIFPAANDDQWTLIKRVIDQSDYYVVIVGGRYGSTTEEGISFTEKEYDYALELGLPILGFVHNNPDEIPVGKSDIAPKARASLAKFRAKVQSKMTKSYTGPADLGSVVSRALSIAMRNLPREGWVRGSEAMTPEVKTEIAELRAALADRQRVEAVAAASADEIHPEFEHGDDEVDLMFRYRGRYGFEVEEDDFELTYEWDEIVTTLGPFMIDEASESSLRTRWGSHAARDARDNDEHISKMEHLTFEITDSSWGQIIVQLRALGIIMTSAKKHGVADKGIYWTLTEAGDRYLVGLRAVRRVSGEELKNE